MGGFLAYAVFLLASGLAGRPELAPPPSFPQQGSFQAVVIDVFEADTLLVQLPKGRLKVRLNRAISPKGNSCFAAQSRSAARGLLLGHLVTLQYAYSDPGGLPAFDVSQGTIDPARWLVAGGFAFARYDIKDG